MSGVELNGQEVKRLKLEGKLRVNWWGSDNTPIEGKHSFYYIGYNLKEQIELVQVPPACLIIREREIINNKRTKSHISIDGLPDNFLKFSNFSYYYIGAAYSESFEWETYVRKGSDVIQRITEIAPIVFLNKK